MKTKYSTTFNEDDLITLMKELEYQIEKEEIRKKKYKKIKQVINARKKSINNKS